MNRGADVYRTLHATSRRSAVIPKPKATTVGSSVGIVLTKEVLGRLKVAKGDSLYLTEASDGVYRITPYDPDFQSQMDVAEKIRSCFITRCQQVELVPQGLKPAIFAVA
mgnify:CR=1 FL=1